MHYNPYGGPAARVAAALVNVGAAPAAQMLATMRAEGMSVSRLSAADAAEIAAWARRLRPVFTESDVDTKVDLVNRLLVESASRPYISRHDGKPPHLHYAGINPGVTEVHGFFLSRKRAKMIRTASTEKRFVRGMAIRTVLVAVVGG